jgi:hypothetical protein
MTRTMKITVSNLATSSLVLTSDHLKHGKWTDGVEPTPIIKPKEKGFINSQKQTGSSYGTEGYCMYVIMDNGANPTFDVSWSKPHDGKSFVKVSDTPEYSVTVEDILDTTENFEALVTVNGKK